MKLSALTRMMNDHGTKRRIRVLKHMKDYTLLVYEGDPNNANDEVKALKVNSFTALGTGYLEIHTN